LSSFALQSGDAQCCRDTLFRLQPTDQDRNDIDASLRAASERLLREMNELIELGRRLVGQGPAWSASPGTLGAVLYSRPSPVVPEADWVSLVRAIAERDEPALHALCERTHDVVLELVSRITGDRRRAEALAIDVLLDIWREAGSYDPSRGTVLAWIMNRARAKALEPRRGTHEVAEGAGASPEARVARRIAAQERRAPLAPRRTPWKEPAWAEVAPGISVKLLATDTEKHIVSMLVRLAPGAAYPAHTHAGIEELHLLEGELWIDDRKLVPGDYNRAPPGTGDDRVWSETGCSCVLVTSTRDILR
jgi:DNA-directed RNA polymerase specialized sigma24 family protein